MILSSVMTMPKVQDLNMYILPPIFTNINTSRNQSINSTSKDTRDNLLFNQLPNKNCLPIKKDFLKSVSSGFQFSTEVVQERCAHLLPYADSCLQNVLRYDDIINRPVKNILDIGRHNTRVSEAKHQPCHLKHKILIPPLEKPLKVKQETAPVLYKGDNKQHITDSEMLKIVNYNAINKLKQTPTNSGLMKTTKSCTFVTASEDVHIKHGVSSKMIPALAVLSKYKWESYMLSLLGKRTSHWIVQKCVSNEDRERFEGLIESWHGKQEGCDLLREDDFSKSRVEFIGPYDKLPMKRIKSWSNPDASLLVKIYGFDHRVQNATDPYSDDNQAPFYRQPTSIRQQKKTESKEQAGSINATANEIQVKTFEPAPPPNLRDFMNPKVGDKCHVTSCAFENERLTGITQVHQCDMTKIVMETNSRYRKQLRSEYPPQPIQWDGETVQDSDSSSKKVKKGANRWTNMPEPIDDTKNLNRFPKDLKIKPVESKFKQMTNLPVTRIVDNWRLSMHKTTQFFDSTLDDLIVDMADVQSHVRLKAVSMVAKAAALRSRKDGDLPGLDRGDGEKSFVISEKIVEALRHLLKDVDESVRSAAAVTLYSLDQPDEMALNILMKSLRHGNRSEKWATVQCLAQHGTVNSEVIAEIIETLMVTEDSVRHEQATNMLVKISLNSHLVHSLVAEQLNSHSWRHKVIACKVLPGLHGQINKDVTNKLVSLMWCDWHADVRYCAAQALGKTGNGRVIHEDLISKITTGNESMRLEAISKIGHLGIMTGKLLPAFINCFRDAYSSVRTEACITCGNLRIREHRILEQLIRLASHDNIWKIKAMAMQALAKIGEVLPEIKPCLVWATRYEAHPVVRAEACHSLSAMGLVDKEVANILQGQMLVEAHGAVRMEITQALDTVGVSLSEDMNMVTQIKKEVHKLGQPNLICHQIYENERETEHRRNKESLIYSSKSQLTLTPSKRRVRDEAIEGDNMVAIDKVRVSQNIGDRIEDEHLNETVKVLKQTETKKKFIRKLDNLTSQDEATRQGTENVHLRGAVEVFIEGSDRRFDAEVVEDESSKKSSLAIRKTKVGDSKISGEREVEKSFVKAPIHMPAPGPESRGKESSKVTASMPGIFSYSEQNYTKKQSLTIPITEIENIHSSVRRSVSSAPAKIRSSTQDSITSEEKAMLTVLAAISRRVSARQFDVLAVLSKSRELGSRTCRMDASGTDVKRFDVSEWFKNNKRVMMKATTKDASHPLLDSPIKKTRVTTTSTPKTSLVLLSAKDILEKDQWLETSDEIFVSLDRRYSQKLITLEEHVGFLKMNRSEDGDIIQTEVSREGDGVSRDMSSENSRSASADDRRCVCGTMKSVGAGENRKVGARSRCGSGSSEGDGRHVDGSEGEPEEVGEARQAESTKSLSYDADELSEMINVYNIRPGQVIVIDTNMDHKASQDENTGSDISNVNSI